MRRATVSALAGVTLLAALNAAPAAQAADERTVDYRGYEIDVPADWPVFDLAQDPTTCVRFDRPAVYLGTPGEQQDCPSHLVGRTTGLVIEPLTADAVRATADGTIRVPVPEAGLLVSAAHGPAAGEAELVRDVLATARVTADAEPAPVPAPAKDSAAPLAAAGPQPGTYTGRGFDACAAPSLSAMNTWRDSSPYQAVGVYISGGLRACSQPNLTASWVTNTTADGWHLMPIDVGRQAPCTNYASRMSTDPATARSQGSTAAASAVTAAQNLGIPAGSAIYSDIEAYTRGGSCTTAVLNYVQGWTQALHDRGYLSGVYSSAASGIADLVAAVPNTPAELRVDHIWFAWWNNVADTDGGSYIPDNYWNQRQRIHQFRGGATETYGGVSINIDRNYLDVVTR